MALTKNFTETVKARAQRDPEFRKELLLEAFEAFFVDNDFETGKILLRDYINATEGFGKLSAAVDKPEKSLMRMLGPRGNPKASNLLQIVAHLSKKEKVRVKFH